MPVKIRFQSAAATGLVLAKVGNPQRDEPLQTSREVFRIGDEDRPILTELFLRPFKNLPGQRFVHHSSLDQHEMNNCAKAIFTSENGLYDRGCDIARRLYSKSTHPAIKAGDLCISLIRDVEVNGELTQALCILKAESMVPFLSISTHEGDLQLSTEHGINPEKIDKGCLIVDRYADQGYYVLTFDRAGAESRFWVRDFLGVQPVPDSAFLTQSYAEMAVSFLAEEHAAEAAVPEETCTAAQEAIAYFDERETFDLREFEEEVLKTPEAVAKFTEHRTKVEEEQGVPLQTSFEISKKSVSKARKKIGAVLKLDTGVDIHIKSTFASQDVVERGFDEEKSMNYIKVYYNEEFAE